MKNYFYGITVVLLALCSCSKADDDWEPKKDTPLLTPTPSSNDASVFTVSTEPFSSSIQTLNTNTWTWEPAPESLAAQLDNQVHWQVGDKICVDKYFFIAEAEGTTTTFRSPIDKTAKKDVDGYYCACYPTTNHEDNSLPCLDTLNYNPDKFTIPMYARSTTTNLEFKNVCALLAIKVTSADIKTLKAIKVKSNTKLWGTGVVLSDFEWHVLEEDGDQHELVLKIDPGLTLDEKGTIFYIPIPPQTWDVENMYQYLNIYLSSDGIIFPQAMATKAVNGLGMLERNKIYFIDYQKNATKLWDCNLYISDINLGAESPTDYGQYFTWGGHEPYTPEGEYNDEAECLSGDADTATHLWGGNWRMPTEKELCDLTNITDYYYTSVRWQDNYLSSGHNGLLIRGRGEYRGYSVFLPAAGHYDSWNETLVSGDGPNDWYWSSTAYTKFEEAQALLIKIGLADMRGMDRCMGFPIRPVLEE